MLKRKLHALEYPQADSVNLNEKVQVREVISWLEENRIKKSNTDVRNKLRNVNDPGWDAAFEGYKKNCGCSLKTGLQDELEWLLSYAVKQEYSKNRSKYLKQVTEKPTDNETPNVTAANPLDHLDFAGPDFTENVKKMAQLLKIQAHSDPFVTLQAISKVIANRLSDYALKHPDEFIVKGTPFPFQDVDLGSGEIKDPIMKKAANILRLLYIQNLRDLQTKANELIVAVQSVTANPKTDTRLGKVGI